MNRSVLKHPEGRGRWGGRLFRFIFTVGRTGLFSFFSKGGNFGRFSACLFNGYGSRDQKGNSANRTGGYSFGYAMYVTNT